MKTIEEITGDVVEGLGPRAQGMFVTDLNERIADRVPYVTSAWLIGEALKTVYGARRRRWEHGRVLVYDFPHLGELGGLETV
ncbi:hypothetical protein HFN49_04055 [Rhizobium leguminosarum]|uniref:hypothetical protein n=1 Tax=Rhizobium ruizarguesonis TaxID=2081791 RepID=UPI001A984A0E|nr:hypothetical protein [Rhizobium ruizarguesonis]MBY5885371.1 hypothetical protein [Rhizobium leguminosarum]QSZ00868.1 hypothetical protein J3P73_24155 [Rhizobium ruizarguesonis]